MMSQFALMTVAAGGLALAYLLWRADPAWTLSAAIAAMVFSGNWQYAGVPLPLDRLLILYGVLLTVVRPAGGEPPLISSHRQGALAAVAVAGAYGLLSTVAADGFADRDAFYALLDRFGLIPFALFVVAPRAFRTAHQRSVLLWTLVVLGLYLGVTALFQAFGAWGLVFPRYILNPDIGSHQGRARGPFLDATQNGFALSICAIAALIVLRGVRKPLARWALGGIAFICALGLVLALERSLWLGALTAAVVTSFFAGEVRRRLPLALGAVVVVTVAALAISPGLRDKAEVRLNDRGSVWDRQNSNNAAVRLILDKPLFGAGWHRFETESEPYFRLAADYPLTGTSIPVHNVFLSNAAELGLIGAGLWLVALLAGVGTAATRRAPPELRPWQIGMVALATEWVVIANFSPMTAAFGTVMLWTWAGVTLGARHVAPRPAADRRRPKPLPAT
jgi:O-antigen ligase